MKRIFTAACMFSLSLSSFAHADERRAPEPVPVVENKAERPTLEVAFVLDTTSSMSGLIEGAKQKIWSIASQLASGKPSPRIRIGLVAFRDRGDAYITQRMDLTTDLDAVYEKLKGFRAEGGGDGPEHVGQGLGEAVKRLSWSDGKKVMRMIFVVGDAPAHDDYGDEWNTQAMAKAALQKGIIVNTIRCGNDSSTERVFREISRLAEGHFISIEQSGGMARVETPFDAELAKLNADVAGTTLYAGRKPARTASEGKARGTASMEASAAADRLSYAAKLGGSRGAAPAAPSAETGSFDLTAEPAKLAALREEEMPDTMKGMKAEERAALVKKNADTRKALEAKITALAQQRDAWLAKNASKKADSFDEKVMSALKPAAAKVGVGY
ncbi:MAG: VWA domain-containing protein [Myxococcaceae bacterium]|nr:VWA domain-containing protein [Myxococcaceae bacterium]